MGIQYLGHLPESDSLYGYLRYDIQPQLRASRRPVYRVFKLNGSNDVYLYEEKYTGTKTIGKFFLSARESNHGVAARRLTRECHHLALMRSHGFSGSPHYIARPLGCNASLNQLLMVEYCNGELLSRIITRAIQQRDDALLFGKLTALAYFLASFHNRTANPYRVNFQENCHYMDSLIGRLENERLISGHEAGEFYWLRDCWKGQPRMWEDCQVLTHGDATPENFLFGDGPHVISFDLERLRRNDRVFDTGRLAGELAHFFLAATGNRYAAQPFIGHFLWEYACHFPDREQAFRAMTGRVPFYMGITFLRIARNRWLHWDYRKKLVYEAKECLWGWQR